MVRAILAICGQPVVWLKLDELRWPCSCVIGKLLDGAPQLAPEQSLQHVSSGLFVWRIQCSKTIREGKIQCLNRFQVSAAFANVLLSKVSHMGQSLSQCGRRVPRRSTRSQMIVAGFLKQFATSSITLNPQTPRGYKQWDDLLVTPWRDKFVPELF